MKKPSHQRATEGGAGPTPPECRRRSVPEIQVRTSKM